MSSPSPAVADEIVLSSNQPQFAPKKIILRNVTSELFQQNRLDGVQKLFRIYDNRILSITEKSKKGQKQFMIALSLLDEKPKRKNEIVIQYVLAAIGLAIVAYIIHYFKSSGVEFLNGSYANYVKILLGTLALGSFYCFCKIMRNSLVFKTANGQIPVVELFENRPNKAKCQDFLYLMTAKITSIKKGIIMPSEQKFAVEISEHRRLRDEGVITEEQYDLAKDNIFESQAQRNKSLKFNKTATA